MENWLYGENVVVWNSSGWRPDIVEFLNQYGHPSTIRMVKTMYEIPMGALIVYHNGDAAQIEELKSYGRTGRRGWRFYPQDQLDTLLRYLMANPKTATPEPKFNAIAPLKPDDTYGDW